MILRTKNLTKHFDGILALENVSVEFLPGTITTLIGSNGAGKTTLFNSITGFISPDSGTISLTGETELKLNGLAPFEIAQKGVGLLFQTVRIFPHLSVLENVAVGAQNQPGERPFLSLLQYRNAKIREIEILKAAHKYLDFVNLNDYAHIPAGQLSYGQQKLLALARLLSSEVSVLLLDELTSGLHPHMINQVLNYVKKLAADHNRTIILIEHNEYAVRQISDRVYQMEAGRIVAEGSVVEVLGTRRDYKPPCLKNELKSVV